MENPRPRLRRRRRFSPRAGYCVLSSLLSSPPFPGFLSLSRYRYYCAAPPLLSFCGMRACIQRSRGALPPLLIASSSSSSSGGDASVASLFLPRMDDVRSRWQRRSPPLSSTIRSLFLRKERGGDAFGALCKGGRGEWKDGGGGGGGGLVLSRLVQ